MDTSIFTIQDRLNRTLQLPSHPVTQLVRAANAIIVIDDSFGWVISYCNETGEFSFSDHVNWTPTPDHLILHMNYPGTGNYRVRVFGATDGSAEERDRVVDGLRLECTPLEERPASW